MLVPVSEWSVADDRAQLQCTVAHDFRSPAGAVRVAIGLSLARGASGSATFAPAKDPLLFLGPGILTPLPGGTAVKVVGTAMRDVASSKVTASFVMD